jgi:hypothetical protein
LAIEEILTTLEYNESASLCNKDALVPFILLLLS